jgi:hypothetical protein
VQSHYVLNDSLNDSTLASFVTIKDNVLLIWHRLWCIPDNGVNNCTIFEPAQLRSITPQIQESLYSLGVICWWPAVNGPMTIINVD